MKGDGPTVDGHGNSEIFQERGTKCNQYLAALAASIGAFTVGTILSWSSSAIPMLQNSTTTPLDEPITEDQGMWIGSLLAIGALIGAFPAGVLADKIGRKYIQMGLGLPFVASWLTVLFAKQIGALYVARLLAGFAVGGICVVAPMYIGEIAEPSIRGSLGSIFQLITARVMGHIRSGALPDPYDNRSQTMMTVLLLTAGILFSYVVGALVDYTWLAIIDCVIPIVFLSTLMFVPETPFYLMSRNRKYLAERSLKWLRGGSGSVHQELCKIEDEVIEAARNKGTFRDLISSRANVKALMISVGLMFFQQLCGINAVVFYAAQIFRISGTDLNPDVCAIIVGVFQVVFTYGATILVDRAGRKMLLLMSSGVMIVCLFILGTYFQLMVSDEDLVRSIGWLPLLAVNVFVVFFSLGFGPLPWLMMGELFSSSIKEMASALVVICNWLLVFVVTKTFQDLINALGSGGAFWLFGAISCVGFIFILFVVKETKGKTFGEIQAMLST